MTRDTTFGATSKRLIELGYAPTSFTHPDRIVHVGQHANRREAGYGLRDHPAAIMCYPTEANGALVDDGDKRQVIHLIATAYLLSDPRQAKAAMAVLDKYGLTAGPYYMDSFGNRHIPLQYHGETQIYARHRTRLCFDSDDDCVKLEQAIEPSYVPARDPVGGFGRAMTVPPGTHAISVGGDWQRGHILDTPHRKLPELLQADARQLIEDIELARWGARPLAKDGAA